MKTQVQRILAFALLTLVAALPVVHAQQNQTDYQVVQGFRTQYNNLKSQVESARTVDDINNVISKINALENQYESHKQLIDSSIYPDTYDGQMSALKSSAQTKLSNLQTIQQQSQQLANLNQQVTQYSKQLQMLSTEADSIRKVMVKSQTSERNLRALVRRYRDNMQKRDQLIQSMIDTLYVASNKNMPQTESAKGKQMGVDVLGTIHNLIEQNMNFIDNNPTMSTEDFLHMYDVQAEFSDMWSQLGDKIAAVYSGNKKAMDVVNNINQANQQWHSKISDNTFKSIAATFKEQGFDLSQFNDGSSLYSALRTYLDNAVKRSREHADNAEYQNFQKFSDLWNNTVKTKWAESLVTGKIMTYDQIANVDAQITQWGQLAQPKSYAMFIYLGIALLVIIILAVMLIRAKSSTDKS
ncbi:MAG TPA: hypothetical protein VKA08_06550 [Balneolales bacterium]|nr:hypothetical protein [Balneolales bacterium]